MFHELTISQSILFNPFRLSAITYSIASRSRASSSSGWISQFSTAWGLSVSLRLVALLSTTFTWSWNRDWSSFETIWINDTVNELVKVSIKFATTKCIAPTVSNYWFTVAKSGMLRFLELINVLIVIMMTHNFTSKESKASFLRKKEKNTWNKQKISLIHPLLLGDPNDPRYLYWKTISTPRCWRENEWL